MNNVRAPASDGGVGPEIITGNASDAKLEETCQYIVNRISEYSPRPEYGAEEYNDKVLIAPDTNGVFYLSWTSHHPINGSRNIRLPLSTLNISKISTDRGVIWLRTRGKTISVQMEKETYYEDQWWIDVHDDQVARNVARALIHAGKLCNPDIGKDPFAK